MLVVYSFQSQERTLILLHVKWNFEQILNTRSLFLCCLVTVMSDLLVYYGRCLQFSVAEKNFCYFLFLFTLSLYLCMYLAVILNIFKFLQLFLFLFLWRPIHYRMYFAVRLKNFTSLQLFLFSWRPIHFLNLKI